MKVAPTIHTPRGTSATNLPVTGSSSFNSKLLQKDKTRKRVHQTKRKHTSIANKTEKKSKFSEVLLKALLMNVYTQSQGKLWWNSLTCHLLQTCLFSTNKPHESNSACARREAGSDEGSTYKASYFICSYGFQFKFSCLRRWTDPVVQTYTSGNSASPLEQQRGGLQNAQQRRKGEEAQATAVAQCRWSIIKVPCQVLVGVVSIETHLKFSRKQRPHEWHLLQVKKKRVRYFTSLSQADKI